jgi:hypothetical protein
MKHESAMNESESLPTAQGRYALRVVAHLHEGAEELPSDITERLRHARFQALERAQAARRVQRETAGQGLVISGPQLALGGHPAGKSERWWMFWSVLIPALTLVVGLGLIQSFHSESEIVATAEVDAALLADELPLEAYRDSAFVEYLRNPVVE